MTEGCLPVGAKELLEYFEGVAREHPEEHWRSGADLCRWWLCLAAGPIGQGDVDQFIQRLESEKAAGSGWLDLGLQFRAWARTQGFAA